MNGLQSRYVPVMGTLNFLGLWCRHPLSIGAVVPSSLGLAAAIAREVDFPGPGVVVELGGGTGSVTRELLRTVPRPNDIVVVERERSLCSLIAARCPGVRVVCGDARNLQALLAEAGVERIKAIASSLPLLSIAGEARDEIIRQSFATLAPDGVLVQL